MDISILEAFEKYIDEEFVQAVISNSTDTDKISKVKIRPLQKKNELVFQVTKYCGQKVLHSNHTKKELLEQTKEWFEGLFKQVQITTTGAAVTILISKKGKATIKEKKNVNTKNKESGEGIIWEPLMQIPTGEHNRKKNYIFNEGDHIPFLIDLGIMTSEGKVVHSKYDKFKQINRYLEFVEDVLPNFDKRKEVSIIDFGCGKSYLTFAMYHYLKVMKGYDVHITGLDLKEDVIRHCNELKDRYGFEHLNFQMGNIATYTGAEKVDMVVTLHACDTATDYALEKAVSWGAKVILSVPCCQHELNRQIDCKELGSILKYGLIKERMAALMTDALRANLLETLGYKVQVMEFIDMEHTPKNILLRAVKNNGGLSKSARDQKLTQYKNTLEFLNVNPTLYNILKEAENASYR